MNKTNQYSLLDLFSGCGGLSYGFQQAGFEVIAGIDNWKDALATFQKNHPTSQGILMDLAVASSSKISQQINKSIDVIVGGPPCQGFSISGKRNPDDPRNLLYKSFLRVIDYFQPKAIVMENVPNMVSMAQGRIREQILTDLERLGYQVQYKILLASDYGVPQNRRRVIFVGVPKNYEFNFPIGDFTENKITCSQAMNDLPEESMTDGEPYPINPLSSYQKLMRIGSDQVYNHQITKHSQKTINTIAMVPDGGNYKDLPKHLQGTRKVNIAWTRYSSQKPSLTIDRSESVSL
ncbi:MULTISPECIES: DNA cytosine methyltransferase [Crocosphaera]|uniref:Cytosine-specific methyltransferase n=3 Tax=Crocosphaera watsonii TaxID=263511 RepID=G5J3N5_CROWT|nr:MULTISPECIES: DNA cytosine methyltransferase [Crocosphaera]EHJ13173.1 putative 5-methylcytosine methyltransferase [Crocosphaera watsonii WH 0003]MCH2243695.1 DNA cytosine methyltransferase [Crocosphaera sp.]NQZ61968.1 DNA cytosine methyltransferase [Crocosphaera sp.]CCQ59007.1 putative 5-methylcytosine methyltransferase [Crocosphaera watsonii WH 0005]